MTHHHERQDKHTFEKELHDIYTDEHGNPLDMTSIAHKERRLVPRWVLITIGVVATASLIAWAGFLSFNPHQRFKSDRVDIVIVAPLNTYSGREVDYTLTIENKEEVTLNSPVLDVKVPKGFTYISSTYPAFNNVGELVTVSSSYKINLPDIKPQESIDVHFVGKIIGEIGFSPTLQARLVYRPESYSSDFEVETSFSSKITDTVLALTTTHPEQIIKQEPVTLEVSIKNIEESTAQSDVRLELKKPESFKVTDIKQAITTNNEANQVPVAETTVEKFNKEPILDILEIKPQEEVKFILIGEFAVDTNETQEMSFVTSIKDSSGEYRVQNEEKISLQVIATDLVTNLIINGKTESMSISRGDKLSYLVTLQNKSSSAISDVEVKVVVDGAAVDWKTLSDEAKGIVNSGQILWTKDHIKELGVLLPEDEIEIPFTISTKPGASAVSKIESFVEITVGKVDTIEVDDTSTTNKIAINFNSDLALQSRASYFDAVGNALGSGPLPPRVGEKTTYLVTWTLSNTLHELTNLAVSAQLPTGTTFVDSVDITSGSMKQDGDKLIWNLPKFPTTLDEMTATFKVSVTPQPKDANTLLSLLGTSYVTAQDSITQGSITVQSNSLTTKIGDDSGLVQD